MRMKNNIIICLCFVLVSINAYAETIVFEGTPRFKSVSMPQESFSELVDGEKQNTFKVVITKEGNDYVYFSRNKYKLRYFKPDNGVHYFIRPDHTDYIKIAPVPDDGEIRKVPGMEKMNYFYMESISDGMKVVITYWGYAEKLDI